MAREAVSEVRISAAPQDELQADLCVVGGGMAGLCAAIAAARRGARVVLLQDRPVLGGNASSEVRMWICGAHGPENKETGILEEIQLENLYRNPTRKYPIWDSIMYHKAQSQEGLTLMLNCAVCEVETASGAADGQTAITAVRAWHLTAQKWVRVEADTFADCSGDSVLRLSGAPYRWGREARDEFDEAAAPEVADRKTMGNSLLLQLREIDPEDHAPFIPPVDAYPITEEDAARRGLKPKGDNFWWLEVGGEQDTMADADAIRDELMQIAYGVWAYIKNHPDGRGHAWELEWIGQLPGKRENVRYVGDHILTQNDIEAGGVFEDIVAFGGWTMDDHPPGGFHHRGAPTKHWPAPSPYGIPYRCLYSRDVPNLFFAGRNISASHMAMSSTRVMATCALVGQAVGTAAALCAQHRCTPREVYTERLAELQVNLQDDDCYLPGHMRQPAPLSREAELAASAGDPAPLQNGVERALGDDEHGWLCASGDHVTFTWDGVHRPERVRLLLDSDLRQRKMMPCSWPLRGTHKPMPDTLVRDFTVELRSADGRWREVAACLENRRRVVHLPIDGEGDAARVCITRTWGECPARVFSIDFGMPEHVPPPTSEVQRREARVGSA